MNDVPAKRQERLLHLSPNARVSIALGAVAVMFYIAIVLNHLPP